MALIVSTVVSSTVAVMLPSVVSAIVFIIPWTPPPNVSALATVKADNIVFFVRV